ncbi:MAG: hypothetical protein U0835_02115 [Isosphaeraceae bacterium]
MRRNASVFLAAALLALAGTADARAQPIFTNSSATFGAANSFSGQGTVNGPFTNRVVGPNSSGGNVLLSGSGAFNSGVLLPFGSVTFSNLGPNVTGFGLSITNSFGGAITSVTTDTGGSTSTSQSLSSGSFAGYTSATPFTSITLNFNGFTVVAADYRLVATAVPEPSTLLSGAMVVLTACGAAVLRRKKGPAPAAAAADDPAAV